MNSNGLFSTLETIGICVLSGAVLGLFYGVGSSQNGDYAASIKWVRDFHKANDEKGGGEDDNGVVSHWHDGKNFYVIWKFGFCIQGGEITNGKSANKKTITLHKAFSSMNYIAFKNYHTTSHTSCEDDQVSCLQTSASTFDVYGRDSVINEWVAFGWVSQT